ncbi:hypothetical protein QP162_06890 [Sphingomonas aurantiaca]|uniref:hypothetical protein n=1 Tax=Sphingomonas aurantiaca TaxID=185949 RepID=UPI002FE13974
MTYGLVVKPSFIRGLVFSVDRYQIRIDNSLGYNDYTYYTDGCQRSNGDPFFCSGIVRQPGTGILYAPASSNPTSGFIRQGTTNYYKSISRGIDFQAQYTLALGGAGKVDWNFNSSLTTFAGSQDSAAPAKAQLRRLLQERVQPVAAEMVARPADDLHYRRRHRQRVVQLALCRLADERG